MKEFMRHEETLTDVISIDRIMEMIPHRYPMLMIDRIEKVITDKSAVGIKNVTINEPYFQGHFPTRAIMPGVLIVESMAQTAAVLVVHSLGEEAQGKIVYFMSIENCRFRRPVTPGDTMSIRVVKTLNRSNVWKFSGKVYVEEILAAEAVFAATLVEET